LTAVEKPDAIGGSAASDVQDATALWNERSGSGSNTGFAGELFLEERPIHFLRVPKLHEPRFQTRARSRYGGRLVRILEGIRDIV